MPSSLRLPKLFRSRRSFARLRSFHLSPLQTHESERFITSRLPKKSLARGSISRHMNGLLRPIPANLALPLRGSTIVTLSIIASLFFIMSISFAFLGADIEEPYIKTVLDGVAASSPGLVLFGENVDVDVDEPSITIRWSIMACGRDYVLPESMGAHGSTACGLPNTSLRIFVDNGDAPAATYDPSIIPINKETGHRRNIQNLVQFDSDHVLDVHHARLYPFDTYFLTSTLRAVDFFNKSIPIQKLATIDITSSFDIGTRDVESFSKTDNGTIIPSRDIDMTVERPGSARFFTFLLFTVSWVLAHITIAHVIMARRLSGLRPILKHLLSSAATLICIPQLRNSMPDAPGLDGVLIDTIGYFPQMVISSISTIILLLILAVREFDFMGLQTQTQCRSGPECLFSCPSSPLSSPPSSTTPSIMHPSRPFRPYEGSQSSFQTDQRPNTPRPPSSPKPESTPEEIARWERYRMMKHLQGHFVFPPVQPPLIRHLNQMSSQTRIRHHRKVRTILLAADSAQPHRSNTD